ncbi:MAG: pantoate--beta-alanine ligase [Phycisphaerales bacterium]
MRLVHDPDMLVRDAPTVLVPTMGALHPGHDALIETARAWADDAGGRVVVSVFVNPAQFNESQDFDDYPRTLESDAARCEALGVDDVFAPSVEAVYPPDGSVETPPVPAVGTRPGLEDTYRPGHFPGVCKVCKRLFELTGCDAACFGEKDWQQLATVDAMVHALGMGVKIIGVETVREPDGVALSSRNVHLDPEARAQARSLSRALVEAGRHDDPNDAERAGRAVLDDAGVGTEYFAVRDAATLMGPRASEPARVLVAARVGVTRLIDNAPWPGFAL